MALVVADKTQNEMVCARSLITRQPRGSTGGGASKVSLPRADGRRRLAIILFEEFVHPLVCPIGVVIQRQSQIHRPGEGRRVAPGLAGDTRDLGPLLGPCLRLGRDWHPAIEQTPHLSSAANAGYPPPKSAGRRRDV